MGHREENNGNFNFGDIPASTPWSAVNYSDDELAVLAENFFQQRPEIEGSVNWWNVGDNRAE